MSDFEKLKTNVTTAVQALEAKTEANKAKLEQSFVAAMKSWDDAIVVVEADSTQTDKAKEERQDYVLVRSILKQELTNLLEQKNDAVEVATEKTKQENMAVAQEVTKNIEIYTIDELQNLKNKPWEELWIDAKYIITIQHLIIKTGAKHNSIQDDVLTNGIYGRGTKAGILTLQKYLNTKYTLDLVEDGLAGNLTLQALLEKDGDKTRLENLMQDHKDIIPQEPNKNQRVKQNSTWWTRDWSGKWPLEVVTVDQKNKEIPETSIKKVTEKLRKSFPKFDESFLREWARGILSIKESATTGEFIYKGKTYYFDTTTTSISGKKPLINKELIEKNIIEENIDNQTIVDKNILIVNQKRIESWLHKFMKTHSISFEGEKNKILYDEYYKNHIINLKNTKIKTSTLADWKTRINFLENWWYTKYYVDLTPQDFIKKTTNDINYETINNSIKKDIISKVNKEIEQKESWKLQERYKQLENYLEKTRFPLASMYSLQEQKNTFVQAFFEDFPQWLEFDRWDSKFDKKNKKIIFEFDNKWKNKYWSGIMDINDKFNKEGVLDEDAIKKAIKSNVDQKIKKENPNYN